MKCQRPNCNNARYRQGVCAAHYRHVRSGYADFKPVAERYALLRAKGLTVEQIAKLSGVHADTLRTMGTWTRGRVRLETADRLLAVRVPEKIVPSKAQIPAVGTLRRIQALAAAGHSLHFQAKWLGVTQQAMTQVLRKDMVCAATAAKVAAMFDELQTRPGTSARARNWASRRGWVVPFAWDDDIDDPAAKPSLGGADRITAAERIQELMDLGVTDINQIASRLGIDPKSVQRAMSRAAA